MAISLSNILSILLSGTRLIISYCTYSTTDKKKQAYERFPSSEKEKIRAVLFIMDRFSVSWKVYHKLTQNDNNLPRSYLLEDCQASVDDQWKITKTPGNNPGAELPLKDLLEQEIEKHVSKN